jgi:hypothetical protein
MQLWGHLGKAAYLTPIYGDRMELLVFTVFELEWKHSHNLICVSKINCYVCEGISKAKLSAITGRGGLYDCEMLGIPCCVDSWLTDGSKVVSPVHRPHSTPQIHYFSASGTHFRYMSSKPQGLVRPEGLGKLKTFVHLIVIQPHVLLACSTVPQPLCYSVKVYLGFF